MQFIFCVFDFHFCFCFFIISYNAFWFLCALLLPPCSISSKRIKKKRKEIYTKYNLCYSYAHWCMVQFPVASPLKITVSLLNPILSHQPWIAILQPLYHNSECLSSIDSHLYFQKNIIGWDYMKCVSLMYITAPTFPR